MKGKFTNSLFLYTKKERSPEELQPLQEIDEVISLIKNGQWHTLEDVTKRSKLPEIKTLEILQFLANYDLIDLDRKHKKVKGTPSLVKFFKENQMY